MYVSTVVAEGPVNGTVVRVVLGARRTYTPEGALRWLCGQAQRIADGLDPDPYAAWAAYCGPVLVPVGARVPDVPSALRAWCDDPRRQDAARRRLVCGDTLTVSTADDSGRYTLTVVPTRLTEADVAECRARGRRRRRPWWCPGWWPFRRTRRRRHARSSAAARIPHGPHTEGFV
ncbi:hypothetical protein DVK44_07240 [Streptomyces paludis]|uniref:Uncharacterized protein n=1 Tax=Streptomyces paludis TaxID=2282738 RepID=A0A345HLF2_9ACTN|nr:hypothetical protein DVK44_07240 [Streptomyces paludis]